MRQFLARFCGSEMLSHTQSSADFITPMCGFRFSAQAQAKTPAAGFRVNGGSYVRGLNAATLPEFLDQLNIYATARILRRQKCAILSATRDQVQLC
jgi:hypothetical protein